MILCRYVPQVTPSLDPLIRTFSLAQWPREEGRTYYTTICNNLQTLPGQSSTRPTAEGTVSIPRHNYVVGEQH